MDHLHEQIQALHRGEIVTVEGIDQLLDLRDYLATRGYRTIVNGPIGFDFLTFKLSCPKLRPGHLPGRGADAAISRAIADSSAAAAAFHSPLSTGTAVQQVPVAVATSERIVRGCCGFALGILAAALIGRWSALHGFPLTALGFVLPTLGALTGGLPTWRGK